MKWYQIKGLSYTDQPFIKRASAGGKKICLVGYEGEVFALAAKCPHAGGDLTSGWCADGKLVCPYHRYSYNLTTGRGNPGQNDYVETYPVKVVAGDIYVGISSFLEKIKELFK